MNLYEYSQENNDEMGILVSKEEDRDLYEAIHKQALRYVGNGEATESGRERPAAKTTRKKEGQSTTKTKVGFCIRCKTDLPANPTQPYCKRCYASWKRYENKTYEENIAIPGARSIRRPCLNPCVLPATGSIRTFSSSQPARIARHGEAS